MSPTSPSTITIGNSRCSLCFCGPVAAVQPQPGSLSTFLRLVYDAMQVSCAENAWACRLRSVPLKFLNSSFSSSNFSIRAFRAYPLIEIRQTVPCRAIRGKSSDSRQQYLSQQYPPPLLVPACTALGPVEVQVGPVQRSAAQPASKERRGGQEGGMEAGGQLRALLSPMARQSQSAGDVLP